MVDTDLRGGGIGPKRPAVAARRPVEDGLTRRSYLQLVGSGVAMVTALDFDFGSGDAPKYWTVTVPAGQRRQFHVGSGKTFENVLIDITAPGADAQIVADGDDWTIRNVGFKGKMDMGSNNGGFSNCIKPKGNGVIEHVYMGDGTYDRVGAGAIGMPSNHAGHIVVRNCHVAEWTDNGLYNANAAEKGRGTVHIDSCYFRDNNVSHFRIAADGSSATNCVVHNTGNTPRTMEGQIDATGVYTGYGDESQHVEIRNCNFDCRRDNPQNDVFNSPTNHPIQGACSWIDVYDTQFRGRVIGNVNLVSGNGNEPDLTPPEGVPMTPEEAALGGTAAGGDDEGDVPADRETMTTLYRGCLSSYSM